MIIEPKQTYVGYRCPSCGNGVVSSVGIFSLGGDMLRLKCECGGSYLSICDIEQDKVRISVPCMMCPQTHGYTVSRSIFFGRDLFVLPCPYTDVNLCFMGEYDRVCQALERTKEELIELIGSEGVEHLWQGEQENGSTFNDPQVLDVILFVINDLSQEGKIECECEDGRCESVGVEVLADGVRVYCTDCGAEQILPTDSLLGAHAFLHCDRLVLQKGE